MLHISYDESVNMSFLVNLYKFTFMPV